MTEKIQERTITLKFTQKEAQDIVEALESTIYRIKGYENSEAPTCLTELIEDLTWSGL